MNTGKVQTRLILLVNNALAKRRKLAAEQLTVL
jgi:hypothetical protein